MPQKMAWSCDRSLETRQDKIQTRIQMTPPSDIADVSIVIPVFNQLAYTQQCLETLNAAGVADSQIVMVNNGSTDGTRAFLEARPGLRTIHNDTNRGCGSAWTQGAKSSLTSWTVVLNNDVLVPPGCLEGLLQFAAVERMDVVSPAMCEGEADYDWQAHGTKFMRQMAAVSRHGAVHGVCFMVHQRVFEAIGYFDEDPKLGGYEDDEFFRRVRRARFRLATTGRAFLHHFGSITQKSMKAEQAELAAVKAAKRRHYYRQKYNQTWAERKGGQIREKLLLKWWRTVEKARYHHTLKELRFRGSIKYQ
jgi:N-acetylglucosaminyl-diphospho-decaprenol L-rhamnosyltransferase